MTAERSPPQSKMSVSPMPSPRVKITYPTRAPSRPAPRETAHEAGPLIFLKKSRGISTRAITPATKPRRIAPSIRIHLPSTALMPLRLSSTQFLNDNGCVRSVSCKKNPLIVRTSCVGRYEKQLERLGPHTTGVGCLYIKDLDKIDRSVPEAIVAESYRTVTAGTYMLRAREGTPAPSAD